MSVVSLLLALLWASDILAAGRLVQYEPLDVEITDMAAVKRGADFFATHCHVCHTMKYAVDDPITKAAGIVDRDPLVLDGHEIPDLSLKALEYSPEHIYTYLQAYYVDEDSPTGYNNLVMVNTKMPNVLQALQGEHRLLVEEVEKNTPLPRLYEVIYKTKPGQVTSEEFYDNLDDLMHYLIYAADPSEVDRLSIAPWVLSYLAILFILLFVIYLRMKKSYE